MRWQLKEDAWKRIHFAPIDRSLGRVLEITINSKQLKRTRAEAVQRFFTEYVSQP